MKSDAGQTVTRIFFSRAGHKDRKARGKWEQIFYSKIEKPLARKIASNTIDALDLGTWAIHSILRRLTNPIRNL